MHQAATNRELVAEVFRQVERERGCYRKAHSAHARRQAKTAAHQQAVGQ